MAPTAAPSPARTIVNAPADIPPPSRALAQAAGQAIRDFDLIRDGDRVLVGLSGGKDSMSLLLVLRHLQRRAPIRFKLGAATVDPEMRGFNPEPLVPFLARLGIPYHVERYNMVRAAKQGFKGRSLCSFCSRLRRGKLYRLARDHGYNSLAIGHHLDDAAETFLMSSFYGGKLRTMRAAYLNDDGDIRVIRPLIYARERQTAAFAQRAVLPLVEDNCPSCDARPTQRNRMKALLGEIESDHSHLFANLKNALKPLLEQDLVPREGIAPGGGQMEPATEQSIAFVARTATPTR